MEGVVATAPAAPFEAAGEDTCQVLPGPTLWNLSKVQITNTSLWGGRSVYWQLVYLNDTYAMVFASDINGSIVLGGPYGASTTCVSSLESGFGGLFTLSFPRPYWLPGGAFARGLLATLAQLNSSSWATTAATNLGNGSLRAWGGDLVAYYTLGYTWLNLVDWTNEGWLVWYQACGIPGRSGEQPYGETGWALNSSPSKYYGSLTGTMSCPVNTNAHFQVSFNQTSSASLGSGAEVAEHLTMGLGNGTYVYDETANSLVSWMASVSLKSSGGSSISPAAEACAINATGLAECSGPPDSWYAVLLSPDGYLLDTYPTVARGNQWEYPNVFVTNNDTLVLVSANSLTGTGDTLSLGGAHSFPQVLGSISL
jgi:hypothetical protein